MIHNIFAANSFLARSWVGAHDIAGTLSKLCLTMYKKALATFFLCRTYERQVKVIKMIIKE